jgi:AcrR family transcriptional regulator
MPIEFRRQQVLDAALRLISEQGYAAVTMEGIARAAKIAKPVVYNAYPGRGPLLEALFEREQARALRALAEALPAQTADPGESLRAWIVSLAHAVEANPEPWRLILVPADETPAVVRDGVDAGRALVLAQLEPLIQGVIAGRPDLAGLDAELTAHALVAACEAAGRLMLADPKRYPPQRLIEFADRALGALGLT